MVTYDAVVFSVSQRLRNAAGVHSLNTITYKYRLFGFNKQLPCGAIRLGVKSRGEVFSP